MIHQTGEKIVAFMPENQTRVLSNEAQAAWGLAALNAAESNLTMPKLDEIKTDKWIDLAKAVFETQVDRWSDKLCLGGLNNQIFPLNLGYDILGSDPNGEFFLLAARLARFTGNQTYSEWAETSYNWAETVGIVNKDYRVRYGLSESKNCSFITEVVDQAFNHATYTEATAIMYNIVSCSLGELSRDFVTDQIRQMAQINQINGNQRWLGLPTALVLSCRMENSMHHLAPQMDLPNAQRER